MRQFCQELIDHFRNLLVIRSVKKPEEILDLADAELAELRYLSAPFTSEDIQRRLTLLIKADGEMAYASFQRLILEMALLKATLLIPVIPINQLLDSLKVLEAGAVHTPSLPWNAGQSAGTATREPRVDSHHLNPTPHTPAKQQLQAKQPSQLHVPPAATGSRSSWEKFVAFAVEKRPALGAVLEHGSPVKWEAGLLEIGFPSASYFLTSAQDADSVKEIQALAYEFNGQETVVKIRAIVSESDATTPSLAEKKKCDQLQRVAQLKQDVAQHPVINEALRIFGGTITDIREHEG
jgi:DNA polymerase-3 subunit gamma/tau